MERTRGGTVCGTHRSACERRCLQQRRNHRRAEVFVLQPRRVGFYRRALRAVLRGGGFAGRRPCGEPFCQRQPLRLVLFRDGVDATHPVQSDAVPSRVLAQPRARRLHHPRIQAQRARGFSHASAADHRASGTGKNDRVAPRPHHLRRRVCFRTTRSASCRSGFRG